ncbi:MULTISPECIES: hypothetical protein [Chryseobacterium]|uniref:hypothetical protein n=1 Tax=Chryseobacterium TaxID=59732 RepID=UPI00192E1682|nr:MULTISPECIES: hypothetical protein [Chryseobacterium]MCD9616039.1 hypothetical protein [Chryseobacterium gleum]QRA41384.1 hypothetical protein JNG87_12160 [Chryseobacterium cucumeris]
MRKNVFTKINLFFSALAILIVFFACSGELDSNSTVPQEQFQKHSNVAGRAATSEELIDLLSKDEDFIGLGNDLINFISDIPNQDQFLANYKDADFEAGGEQYFLKLTGYTNDQVGFALTNIDKKLTNVLEKYPELRYDGSNGEFIQYIVDEACAKLDNQTTNRNLAACQACVKKWKPRMIVSTIFGAVAGGILGGGAGSLYSGWAGAVIGFASAGWGAVDCLEAAGC